MAALVHQKPLTPKQLLDSALMSETLHDPSKLLTPPQPVSDGEFEQANLEWFNDKEGMVLIETPLTDMRKIEDLLGAPEGFFTAPYWVKTPVEHELCPACSRRNNFLDVVYTGLKVRSIHMPVCSDITAFVPHTSSRSQNNPSNITTGAQPSVPQGCLLRRPWKHPQLQLASALQLLQLRPAASNWSNQVCLCCTSMQQGGRLQACIHS